MEHLVLGLVLLAGALAIGNPLNLKAVEKKVLDMAPHSFDDQYQDCSPKMEEELGELNCTEFANNRVYATYWTKAADEWQKREGHVLKLPVMRMEHAVALMAYTHNGSLYKTFNTAVREAGSSRKEYLEKFHFKTLHFLLTQALRILWEAQPPQCYQVYRGVQEIRFTARRLDLVRFGQFASTSFRKEKAKEFGNDTFFSVNTCYGVPIRHFSFYPNENEVLIPPYETFIVTNITYHGKRSHIQLYSTGTCSKYNCEWVKEKQCQDQPCDFSAGRTIVGDPPLLWGLLLAATALAATGGP
ncbi:erythroblast NAD(P)(+)--arginine ADP-ribosyltransferase-like [Numenius arquata]|uniref:erythroblast NAD(P)(+)--arginine ADP-ribosyltransferase-like n=1 Tax=Numenius arquata TaxID=31919 RepID=UPI003D3057B1